MKKTERSLLSLALTGVMSAGSLLAPATVRAQAAPKRPPQYVLLAFDGSKSLDFWRESRAYAANAKAENKTIKFTYLISGVYFLHGGNKNLYKPPYRKAGASAIGFSSSLGDIAPRVTELNRAFKEGHEIGSHANGHFDGGDGANRGKPNFSPWNLSDWSSEFRQFNDLIFGVFANNGLPNTGLAFSQRDMVGFRAPQLGITKDLRPALRDFNFRYDTSQSDKLEYWPAQDKYGIWNFPLARLPIPGTGKSTLSMDYNFYVTQSRGTDAMVNANPALAETFRKQMVDAYLNYFQTSYYGNRAPVDIGHHFSKWNKGAYWNAMKDFANKVCGLPEVKCVTYKELADYLDTLPAATLNAYRAGNFEKLARPSKPLFNIASVVNADVQLKVSGGSFVATSGQPNKEREAQIRGLRTEIYVNDASVGKQISREELAQQFAEGSQIRIGAHLMNGQGTELLSKTYIIRNFNTADETISTVPMEMRALEGDLPEAHADDQ